MSYFHGYTQTVKLFLDQKYIVNKNEQIGLNFESSVAIMLVYPYAKVEFDWPKHAGVGVIKSGKQNISWS